MKPAFLVSSDNTPVSKEVMSFANDHGGTLTHSGRQALSGQQHGNDPASRFDPHLCL
jgi:hypothetical protein